MADRRGTLVPLIILAWIFFSPTPRYAPQENLRTRPKIQDAIAAEERSLEVLNNSTYIDTRFDAGSEYADLSNLTGFEPDRGYAWGAWPLIKPGVFDRSEWSQSVLQGAPGDASAVPLFRNVTGIVHGRWLRSELEEKIPTPHLNLSSYVPEIPFGPTRERGFGRNLTGAGGDVHVHFKEKALVAQSLKLKGLGNVTEMSVDLSLGDDGTGEEYDTVLRGVYFVDAGHAVLTTTSNKFAGIFALPHFTPTDHTFNLSRQVLNGSISRTIQHQIDRDLLSMNPWSTSQFANEERNPPSPQCELIVWLQQIPPAYTTSATSRKLSFLESELQNPTGALLPNIPSMHFRMTAFSPDCGYILRSAGPPTESPHIIDHLIGPKIPVLATRGRRHSIILLVLLALQIALLRNQMKEASTPSTRSRISFYTIFTMALGDGYVCAVCSMLGALFEGLTVDLMAAAFLALVSMLFLGMQFLMQIWNVQAPELRRAVREEVEEEVRRREALLAELREARERRETAAAERAAERAASEAATPTAPATAPPGPPQLEIPAPPEAPTPAPSPPNTTTAPIPARPSPQRPPPTPAPAFYMPSDQTSLLPTSNPNTLPSPYSTDPLNATIPGLTSPLAPLTPTQRTALIENLTNSRVPSFATHYARFAFTLLLLTFLSSSALAWPSVARKPIFTSLAFVYLGFWWPQIWRNAHRNCRKSLEWEFVLGQSGLRVLVFVYFYAYHANVLFVERDLRSLGCLVGWLWVQVCVLGSQALLGPRWFLVGRGRGWVPEAWEWHPVLRADAEGSTLPLGLSERPIHTDKDKKQHGWEGSGKRSFDCAICMQELEVPVVEEDGTGSGSGAGFVLARRGYMVTPCRHIFHTSCLEGWVKYRLQCPVCREGVPGV